MTSQINDTSVAYDRFFSIYPMPNDTKEVEMYHG